MGDNPFSNTPFAAFGGQLAKAWQTGLETWWKALLSDRGRLADLAEHLKGHGLDYTSAGGASTGADDLAKVLEALELLQERTEKLEARVVTLAETVEAMVGYLEQRSGEAS